MTDGISAPELALANVPSDWSGIGVNEQLEIVAAADESVLVFSMPAAEMRATADMLKRAAREKRRLEKAADR